MQKAIIIALTASTIVASAQTTVSLYLPIFDPQSLTADIAGVGPSGQTTWLVRASGDGFVGTGTLVEGTGGATFTFQAPEPTPIGLGYQCSFQGDEAVCAGLDPDSGEIVTSTDTISYFPVQLGTTLPGAHITTPSNSASASAPTSSGIVTKASSRSTGASSTSAAPSGTPTSGSLSHKHFSVSMFVVMLGATFYAFV